MIRAVLIDDLQPALKMLESDLQSHCPEILIVGRAGSVVRGAKLVRQLNPEVVFLDIELEDGTGFDLLEILPEIDFKIIFVTASDQHAIRAFRFSAIDYLLKPINVSDLMDAVHKIGVGDTREKVEVLLDYWSDKSDHSRIALHTSDEIKIVYLNKIIRCESDNNYTYFHFNDQNRFLVTRTLKYFDQLLVDKGFVRVHQTHLVNVDHIKSYIKTEGGYLLMSDGSQVPVSVRRKATVMELLSKRF
jgi:two-component system LytT family response regulator